MKDNLRKKYITLRNNISNKKELDLKICHNVLESNLYLNAKEILAYYPINNEIDIIPIIKDALSKGKKVALPVSLNDGILEFYYIDSLDNLVRGKYNILEPLRVHKATNYNFSICLVPGLCFDKEGYRLGYGKGYYDRFLTHNKITSIGLCYKDFLCSKLPINNYDKKVDYLALDTIIMKNR